MTDLKKAAQQALKALENGRRVRACEGGTKYQPPLEEAAITALKAALAQQEQEPVAWRYQNSNTEREYLVWNKGTGGRNWTPLYTHPPRRETEQEPVAWRWVPSKVWHDYVLSDDPEQAKLAREHGIEVQCLYTHPPRRETEQEPVAWTDPVTDDIVSVARRAAWETDYGLGGKDRAATYTEPLYTAPPRREWRSLTDEDISLIDWEKLRTRKDAVRAVEQALKEKNA